MAALLTGGCACGAVRSECSAQPVMSANCDCRDCRRSTGVTMASIFVIPKAAFKLTGAEVKYHEVAAERGDKVSRGFCPNCGAPLISLLSGMPEVVAIKAGSLDDTSQFKPTMNIYMVSAPAWAPVSPELPQFSKMPTG